MQINNNYSLPSFKSRIILDIGASSTAGTIKINILTNKMKESLIKYVDIINEPEKNFFIDENDFLNKLSNKIYNAYSQIKWKHRKEKQVKSITVLFPSMTNGNESIYAPGIRFAQNGEQELFSIKNSDELGAKSLNYSNLISILTSKKIPISSNCDLRVFQDVMGGVLSIASKLFRIGSFDKNWLYHTLILGGGCGGGRIEKISGNFQKIKLRITSMSDRVLSNSQTGLEKISDKTSVKALLSSFYKKFLLHHNLSSSEKDSYTIKKSLSDFVSIGNGHVITDEKIDLGKMDEITATKLKNILLSSEKYEIENNIISIKNEYKKSFHKIRKQVIDDYADSIARFALISIQEGSNGLIISGPISYALDDTLKTFYNINLAKLVEQRLTEQKKIHYKYNKDEVRGVYLSTAANLYAKANNFQIICDRFFYTKDNSECGSLATLSQMPRSNTLDVRLTKDEQDNITHLFKK